MENFENIIITIGDAIANYALIPILVLVAVWFTLRTRGVQFRYFKEMFRLLVAPRPRSLNGDSDPRHTLTSLQAFMISIASHVGTGNLAGVATAIAIGGYGSVFWMWVIALLAAALSFVECTLAQIFKIHDGNGGFRGGPAYYIRRGIGSKTWAMLFAVLICLTFGFAYNSVQSNAISHAFQGSWNISPYITAGVITVGTFVIICGGIKRVARFSQWIVPIMATLYVLVAFIIIAIKIEYLPDCIKHIIDCAFGLEPFMGGTVGGAIAIGIRRGLFSNEAGEGSAPNAAATADVSHPAKQGLVQALGVYTDTLLICSCTAFIIMLSGVEINGVEGITLTQRAIDTEFPGMGYGATFISISIFFFAFTSIIANYYYGETNIRYLTPNRTWLYIYRLAVCAMVFIGGTSSLGLVWSLADITMSLMALCNIGALILLSKYAFRALDNYAQLRKEGRNPTYYREINPEIAHLTECWPSISGSSPLMHENNIKKRPLKTRS